MMVAWKAEWMVALMADEKVVQTVQMKGSKMAYSKELL